MKILATILLLTLAITCQSQSTFNKDAELKPPFKNQAEQENYWAQELFKKEYKKADYKVYTDEIKEIDNTKFVYDNKYFKVHNTNQRLKLIFSKGILYPQLISGFTSEPRKSKKELDSLSNSQRYLYEMARGDNLTITSLVELKFLSNSPQVKRFRFWVYRSKSANPHAYLFELTNEKATEKTDLTEFIEHSKLTFLKAGWIIL